MGVSLIFKIAAVGILVTENTYSQSHICPILRLLALELNCQQYSRDSQKSYLYQLLHNAPPIYGRADRGAGETVGNVCRSARPFCRDRTDTKLYVNTVILTGKAG